MPTPDSRVSEFNKALDGHISAFKRDVLMELEALLSVENLAALLVQDRLLAGVQADIQQYLQTRGDKSPKGRYSPVAARTIASALTEPLRTDCFRILSHSLKRRLAGTDWLQDLQTFKAAIMELIEKRVRVAVDRRVRMLRDGMLTLGQLTILLQERERQE